MPRKDPIRDLNNLFSVMGGLCARMGVLMVIEDLIKHKDWDTLEEVAEELVRINDRQALNEYLKTSKDIIIP